MTLKSIYEKLEEVFLGLNLENAEERAKKAADEVCGQLDAEREVVYLIRQHRLSQAWTETNEESYDRVMRESGHHFAMKLYRHAVGETVKVPSKIEVVLK